MTDSSASFAHPLPQPSPQGEGAGLSMKDTWREKSAAQTPSPLWGGPGRGSLTINLPLTKGVLHHG